MIMTPRKAGDGLQLTITKPSPDLYQNQITDICRKAGVSVVVVKRLPDR